MTNVARGSLLDIEHLDAKDITALLNRLNTAGPASLVVPSEYLEVVIERK